MKCPYQTKVIHKPEHTDGYIKYFAEDITKFCECVKSECPFYYTSGVRKTIEHCRKGKNDALLILNDLIDKINEIEKMDLLMRMN